MTKMRSAYCGSIPMPLSRTANRQASSVRSALIRCEYRRGLQPRWESLIIEITLQIRELLPPPSCHGGMHGEGSGQKAVQVEAEVVLIPVVGQGCEMLCYDIFALVRVLMEVVRRCHESRHDFLYRLWLGMHECRRRY